MKKSDKVFLSLFILSVIMVILGTFYNFFILKQYDFVVEAACDPETEECFYRDCEEEDACPPNQLETYKIFTVPADRFGSCADNSCASLCQGDEASMCIETVCGETEGNECAE